MQRLNIQKAVGNTVIEVGAPNTVLLFDKPVILTLQGVTGPVGYKPAGSDTWIEITQKAGGTYDNPTALAFPGEAYISNGTDTRIITWHFTGFAGLVAQNLPGSGASHSSGGGQPENNKDTTVLRLFGQDRYQTPGMIAKQYNSSIIHNVILTSGNGFADALSASVLAHKFDGPILLTDLIQQSGLLRLLLPSPKTFIWLQTMVLLMPWQEVFLPLKQKTQ